MTTSLTEDKIREAFEAWASSNEYYVMRQGDGYLTETEYAWQGYQARADEDRERLIQARDALIALGDMHLVQGDAGKRDNPHNNVNLNSNAAWIVCGGDEKSAHKIRAKIEAFKQAIATLNDMLGDKREGEK